MAHLWRSLAQGFVRVSAWGRRVWRRGLAQGGWRRSEGLAQVWRRVSATVITLRQPQPECRVSGGGLSLPKGQYPVRFAQGATGVPWQRQSQSP